jgi:hypothetical protein
MNALFLRRLRMWRRAPAFYAKKLRGRMLGMDDSWLSKERSDFSPGSWQWLALTEKHYGGFKVGSASGANRGGDRMSPYFHGYGETYEEFLKPLVARREERLTVVEVGILNGSGLAIWCDLFPNARVVGLDIDLSNFEANHAALEAAGAFRINQPELHDFDQLDAAKAVRILQEVLGNTKVDLAIDDGFHSIDSIKITFAALVSHMASQFVYFIEDNFDTYDGLASGYSKFRWAQRGEMVIAANR